jgi:hypothetical protein
MLIPLSTDSLVLLSLLMLFIVIRYVLTFVPDLMWCHLGPLEESGKFGSDKPRAKGRTRWKLVDEKLGREVDLSSMFCVPVKARVMKNTPDADKEEWDIIDDGKIPSGVKNLCTEKAATRSEDDVENGDLYFDDGVIDGNHGRPRANKKRKMSTGQPAKLQAVRPDTGKLVTVALKMRGMQSFVQSLPDEFVVYDDSEEALSNFTTPKRPKTSGRAVSSASHGYNDVSTPASAVSENPYARPFHDAVSPGGRKSDEREGEIVVRRRVLKQPKPRFLSNKNKVASSINDATTISVGDASITDIAHDESTCDGGDIHVNGLGISVANSNSIPSVHQSLLDELVREDDRASSTSVCKVQSIVHDSTEGKVLSQRSTCPEISPISSPVHDSADDVLDFLMV